MRSIQRIVLLALLPVLIVSAVTASAAYAVKGGPIWLEKGKVELVAGSSKNIAKTELIGELQFSYRPLHFECSSQAIESNTTNKIFGGNPGTAEATLVLTGCHSALSQYCGIKSVASPKSKVKIGPGEIIEPVKILLGTVGSKQVAELFPTEESSLLYELEIERDSTCGTLKGKLNNVRATGSRAPSPVGFGEERCGFVAEVGKLSTSKTFEAAKSGELFRLGALNLPARALTEAEVWNSSAGKWENTKCSLTMSEEALEQSGLMSLEIEGKEEFGAEI